MEQVVLNRILANISFNLVIKHRYLWILIVLVVVSGTAFGLQELHFNVISEFFAAKQKFKEPSGNNGILWIVAIATIFLLILIFRNPRWFFAPLLVMLSTVILLFGGMGWFGIPVSRAGMFVVPLLIILSVSYSLHLINHFYFHFSQKGDRLQALHYAYAQTTWPCFLSALTTTAVFLSFIIGLTKPIREVGLTSAAGTILTFLLTMIIVPICFSLEFDRKSRPTKLPKKKQAFPLGMVSFSQRVLNFKVPIVISSLLITLLAVIYFPKIPIGTLTTAFIAILAIMVVILKSLWAGLISMIPIVCPWAIIATVMSIFHIDLDILTIMIAPIVIGITVDDTVHFFIHFKEELLGFRDYQRANRQTFFKIGTALFSTSMVLSLGFGILGFCTVKEIVYMGILSVVGIVSALLANLCLTPVLLIYFKPFGRYATPPKPKIAEN